MTHTKVLNSISLLPSSLGRAAAAPPMRPGRKKERKHEIDTISLNKASQRIKNERENVRKERGWSWYALRNLIWKFIFLAIKITMPRNYFDFLFRFSFSAPSVLSLDSLFLYFLGSSSRLLERQQWKMSFQRRVWGGCCSSQPEKKSDEFHRLPHDVESLRMRRKIGRNWDFSLLSFKDSLFHFD